MARPRPPEVARPGPRGAVQVGGASLYKIGASHFDLGDPYHLAVTARWPAFFLGFFGAFGLINLIFALLYLAAPGAIANAEPGSLRDAFFFSVETMATVGYGGMAPSSTYGHVLSLIEILIGLTFTAIFTGLIFVRFSKVKPKMLFADRMVIATHDGRPTLMLRLAYGRHGMLVAANAKLHVIKASTSREGRGSRNAYELRLVRSHLPLVVLTWTLMHPIDEDSPLFGMSAQDMLEGGIRAVVTFQARDHELASDIFDLKSYAASQIAMGMVYQDLVSTDGNNATAADLRKLSLIEPE